MKRSPLTIVVAAVLIVIFGLMLFVYRSPQVRSGRCDAFSERYIPSNRIQESRPAFPPGPIENVYKLDQRVQGLEGKFEQIKLALPDQNIILLARRTFGYRIQRAPRPFFRSSPTAPFPKRKKSSKD